MSPEPGPSDFGIIPMLAHDAPELERVVAGLIAARERSSQLAC